MAVFPVLTKLWITLREFSKSTPDFRQLWASRSPQFDRLHLVLPSDAVAGERVELTMPNCRPTWPSRRRPTGRV